MIFFRNLSTALLMSLSVYGYADIVSYNFDIDYDEIFIIDETVIAMSINDQVPGPTIEAKIGDTLQVTFNNRMDVETSIHWHGILLPNDQDGVPFLNTLPIAAGESFTYEFLIKHAGTYWYHSHTGIQEQRGIYGALVFKEQESRYDYDVEKVIVLSDWTNEDPGSVLRHLKREDDYYALKKQAVQSWEGVLANGTTALRNRVNSSLSRMEPMDISDVGYDAFLINGQQESWDRGVAPGSTVRLRIINASASSYFFVELASGEMTIIEADGMPVEPVQVDRLRIAIAETYDVLVTLPEANAAYELRATSEDVTGFASLYLGDGDVVNVEPLTKPNLYIMDHNMHGNASGMDMSDQTATQQPMDYQMDHSKHMDMGNSQLRMLDEYSGLRSLTTIESIPGQSVREIELTLTGSMERYVWSLNDLVLSESDKIMINKGEKVRLKLVNETMMQHPIHFHGHFFSVINGEENKSPLKHTVNVPPLKTVLIEFDANEEKDWFLHCHNLYHMKSGMAAVVGYNNPVLNNSDLGFDRLQTAHKEPRYLFADLGFQSNMVSGEIWAMDTRNSANIEYDYDYDNDYDIETKYERHLTRFFSVFAGGSFDSERGNDNNTAIIGINYILPLLIESNLRIDTDGKVRLQMHNEHQLTERIKFDWEWNTHDEYRVRFGYEFNKQVMVIFNYDSDFKFGAGMEFRL
jgi:FtsP/CotA-like multicopper oxidase with cupredoxin domain